MLFFHRHTPTPMFLFLAYFRGWDSTVMIPSLSSGKVSSLDWVNLTPQRVASTKTKVVSHLCSNLYVGSQRDSCSPHELYLFRSSPYNLHPKAHLDGLGCGRHLGSSTYNHRIRTLTLLCLQISFNLFDALSAFHILGLEFSPLVRVCQ